MSQKDDVLQNSRLAGHTPGPWVWVGADLSGWKARGELRGMLGDSPAVYPILNEPGVINAITVELDSADARLIAAAPDLYRAAIAEECYSAHFAACHDCSEAFLCETGTELEEEAATIRREAIAKAEGRTE